jgi:xylitol oxidase
VVTNWARNVSFGAARFEEPESVDELRRLVASSSRLKALGVGHSFSPIADTTGDLVSLARLPKTITIDEDQARVTVSAAVTYGELGPHLHQAGYALANLASLPHISVAGACLTGTHGSGRTTGCLATQVAAIELITGDGDVVTLNRDSAEFSGAVVNLGALGVVTTLSLDLEPTYEVRQYVYENLPAGELDSHLPGIFASGYSVSLFTDWRGPVISQVWLKLREGTGPGPGPDWLGARIADGPRHPVPGQSPVNCTTQLGVPGPWHERLPHFKLDFTPSAGQELQTEYLLPADQALSAIGAIESIAGQVSPVLQISEIRTVAADDLWLSPAWQRDSIALHFTWIDDVAAVMPVIEAVEEKLLPLGARPHWGKLFIASPDVIARQYDRLPDFLTLMTRYDPTGKFRNTFIDRYMQLG